MYTTLNRIRKHCQCEDLLEKLFKHLGKTEPDDEPLPLLTILDAAGFEYTLECFLAVDGFRKEKLLLAITFAREVEHLMPAESKKSLDVFERYANGLATQKEFDKALRSAERAAREAYWDGSGARAADAAYWAGNAVSWAADAIDAARAARAAYQDDAYQDAARGDVRPTIESKQEAQLRQLLEKSCTNVTIENSKP